MEFINIIFQILLFLSLFYFRIPINNIYFSSPSKKPDVIDHYTFNIIVYINFVLFLSFLNLDINNILIISFIFLFFFLTFNINNFLTQLKQITQNYFLFIILFIALIVISIDISNSITLGWDAQKFWIHKTINFYNNGTITNLKFLDKGDGYDYPYLGSLLWAIFWKISFLKEEYFGRLFYGFIYIVSLLSLTNRLNSSLYSKKILFLILVLLSYDYIYFAGEQDILLFSFVAFTASLCIKLFRPLNDRELIFNLFLLVLLCNLLIWTKAEGTVYAFIIILSLIFCLKTKKKIKIFLSISLIALIINRILVYKIYNLNIGVNSCCWNDLSIMGIYSKITFDRIFTILQYLIFAFLKNYLIIFSLMLFIIKKNKFKNFNNNLYNYIIILLCLGFFFTAYILTDIDLIFMLKTGLDRLLFSITPFFIIIIIDYLNDNKFEFK